jgi:hypothetical protein
MAPLREQQRHGRAQRAPGVGRSIICWIDLIVRKFIFIT